MDLQADKGVNLSVGWTDEPGNPVDAPGEAAVTWTVDDVDGVLNFTDNGDGTATALSNGTLGTANVHMEATAGGSNVTGDLQIVVVAGDAERAVIVAGEPFEVTPDDDTPPS